MGFDNTWRVSLFDRNLTAVEIRVDKTQHTLEELVDLINSANFLTIAEEFVYMPVVDEVASDGVSATVDSYFTERPDTLDFSEQVEHAPDGEYVICVCTWPEGHYRAREQFSTPDINEAFRYKDLDTATREAHKLQSMYKCLRFAPAVSLL